jgi:hypothetical protein
MSVSVSTAPGGGGPLGASIAPIAPIPTIRVAGFRVFGFRASVLGSRI